MQSSLITSLGGTQITATTDNQGNFTITHVLGDYVKVDFSDPFDFYPYCTAIGYEIELSHANSTFLDNNPNIGTIQISDVLCSDINDCGYVIPPSDIRLKKDIQPLAVVNNHKIYQFKYRADANNTDYVGVMAQDLVGEHDDALLLSDDGFYRVYYDKLGLEMTTLEQWLEHGQNAVIKHWFSLTTPFSSLT